MVRLVPHSCLMCEPPSTHTRCFIDKIRRKGDKPLPKLILKAKKGTPPFTEGSKEEEEKKPAQIGDRDFKDPKIIEFKTEVKEEDKISWRDLENDVNQQFPTLKIVYSRCDENSGQMAFSSNHLDTEAMNQLLSSPVTSCGHTYTFAEPSEESLKKFWEEHGSHYEMITTQKQRRLRKRRREENKADPSKKRQKPKQ